MPRSADEIAREYVATTLNRLHKGFSGAIVANMRLVDVKLEGVDVDSKGVLAPRKGKARSTVVVDIDVDDTMCNLSGNMHGGCTATLLDVISSLPLVAMRDEQYWTFSGVSQNFNVFFLAAVPNGTKLRITSSTMSFGRRSAVADCKFEDRDSGLMYAYGNHTKVDIHGPKPGSKL